MNAQDYYSQVIDPLRSCFRFSHFVVATGEELIADGFDPAFPAIAAPIDRLEHLTAERGLQLHIPLMKRRR